MNLRLLALMMSVLLSANLAWAKKVTVQWKPIAGAISYEIRVSNISKNHQEKVAAYKKVIHSGWTGELPSGLYSYEIRAFDKAHRPGDWSPAKPLVLMPKEPELTAPKSGKEYSMYTPEGKATLSWTAVDGLSKYRVIVKRDSQPFLDQTVETTELELKNVPPGKYEWQVNGVVVAQGRSLASIDGKTWEGKPSSSASFAFEQLKLDSPDLIFPKGTLHTPDKGRVNFKWKSVTGADAYEVHLIQQADEEHAQPAHDSTWIVRGTATSSHVSAEGNYSWAVRALASVDANNVAGAVGAQSNADFKIDRSTLFIDGNGSIAFSTIFAPFTYSEVSPMSNTKGNTASSTGTGTRLNGDYWYKPKFGLGLSFEQESFKISERDFDRKDIELTLKYRTNLSPGPQGWSLTSKFGLLARDYVLLTPYYYFNGNSSQVGGVNQNKFTTLGPTIGFDLRRQFGERLSFGAKLNYYLPVSSGVVRGADSNRNYGLGVQGLYWLSKHWGAALGLYTENRSISHRSSGADPDTVTMDGQYIYASIVYSFGR